MRGRIAAEVAVVAAIVLIVGGIVSTGVVVLRDSAARSRCANNLRQLGLALNNYHSSYHSFPAGTIKNPGLPPERRLSWCLTLVPNIEKTNLHTAFDQTAPADSTINRMAGNTQFRVYVCPASPDANGNWLTAKPVLSYLGLAGVGADAPILPTNDPRAGVFGYDRRTKLEDIKDGPANTVAFIELAIDSGRWADGGPGTVNGLDPADIPYVGEWRRYGKTHAGSRSPVSLSGTVATVGMADGSVRILKEGVAATVVEALATIVGKEDVAGDW